MKSSNQLKDDQVTLAIVTGYLQTCLRLVTQSIDQFDTQCDCVMLDHIDDIKAGRDDETKDLEFNAELALDKAVSGHMKALRESVGGDMDAVDLLKRILPTGLL